MVSGLGEEGVLRKLLTQLNSHIPRRRLRLSELLAEREPCFEGRDGISYVVERKELEAIQQMLSAHGLSDVRLPILLMADPTMSQSAWRVEGREECAVISDVLGRGDQEVRERLTLYAPHLAVIMRRLPTTVVCMYLG
jgi:uncharacterized protein (UPF0216 family)